MKGDSRMDLKSTIVCTSKDQMARRRGRVEGLCAGLCVAHVGAWVIGITIFDVSPVVVLLATVAILLCGAFSAGLWLEPARLVHAPPCPYCPSAPGFSWPGAPEILSHRWAWCRCGALYEHATGTWRQPRRPPSGYRAPYDAAD